MSIGGVLFSIPNPVTLAGSVGGNHSPGMLGIGVVTLVGGMSAVGSVADDGAPLANSFPDIVTHG